MYLVLCVSYCGGFGLQTFQIIHVLTDRVNEWFLIFLHVGPTCEKVFVL